MVLSKVASGAFSALIFVLTSLHTNVLFLQPFSHLLIYLKKGSKYFEFK